MSSCDNNQPISVTGQNLAREILTELYYDGLLSYAVYDICIVYETVINQDASAGLPGEKILTKVNMIPPPRIEVETYLKQEDGVIKKFGETRMKNIVASDTQGLKFTRADLEGASYFLVDGTQYIIEEGSLLREPNGIYWSAKIKRREVGGRTKT